MHHRGPWWGSAEIQRFFTSSYKQYSFSVKHNKNDKDLLIIIKMGWTERISFLGNPNRQARKLTSSDTEGGLTSKKLLLFLSLWLGLTHWRSSFITIYSALVAESSTTPHHTPTHKYFVFLCTNGIRLLSIYPDANITTKQNYMLNLELKWMFAIHRNWWVVCCILGLHFAYLIY